MSDAAVSYSFEELEPSDPPPRDALARLLAEAAADGERIREQARSEGHAEGRAAGREEGLQDVSRSLTALAEALRGVEELRLEVAETVEGDAIELALALAAKVLAGAQLARPELVVEVVQGALRRATERRRITVLLHPADVETVRAAMGDLERLGSGIELCELQADQRVQVGSAIVRTAEGEIDASVATQLERAREVMLSELQAPGP